MISRYLRSLLQMGWELPTQLRRPISVTAARALLRERLLQRESRFLASTKQLIYDNTASPYRALLLWAGCEWSDLRGMVEVHGIEGTLEKLRKAGVHVTLAEFKRDTPIVRSGLTLQPNESDFDPSFGSGAARAIAGTSSGSRSRPSRVMYSWPFIAEEAAHEALLYAEHGVTGTPTALWYPAPPGVAGLHNVLMDLKRGHAPARWFSQVNPQQLAVSRSTRSALPLIRWGARLAGLSVPAPEFADPQHPRAVLEWMTGHCVVRTFASSAVRLAECSLSAGRDLRDAVIFTGGEPLDETRRAYIESTGARVYARYVATESGLIGASCRLREESDDMHVYTDRVALIGGHDGLLMSTISEHTGKVLFNTQCGDRGVLSTRACGCEFGQVGFATHVSHVRSEQRLTVDGMTVAAADFELALADAMRHTGRQPGAWQYWCESDAHGVQRIVVTVQPDASPFDDSAFATSVLAHMRARGGALVLAANMWQQSGALRIARGAPQVTAGGKRPLRARDVTRT